MNPDKNADLIDATINGKQSEVERLLGEGANVNHVTTGGVTPLHWAIIKGHFGIVKLLIDKVKGENFFVVALLFGVACVVA
jgi:ankyrin repeat protein